MIIPARVYQVPLPTYVRAPRSVRGSSGSGPGTSLPLCGGRRLAGTDDRLAEGGVAQV